MGSIGKTVRLPAPADEVWAAVRDFGAPHERLVPGFVTDTRLEGSERIVMFASGAVQREPLVNLDDQNRRLVYIALESSLGASHYNAAVEVHHDGSDSSILVWVVDFLPDGIADRLDAAMDRGAAAMLAAFPATPP